MSRILCVLELGKDLGHLGLFTPLINELIARNHDVVFVMNDLSPAAKLSCLDQVTLLQAPLWRSRPLRQLATYSFADILLYNGYQSYDTLMPQVIAWKNLFKLISADLIIFDHAPTALLASNAGSVPRVIFSNGFTTPPHGSAPICILPDQIIEDDRIEKIEAHVINIINAVARSNNLNEVRYVSDLYNVEATFIAGLSDFDFYQNIRSNAEHIGPLPLSHHRARPRWKNSTSQKLFAYLKYGKNQVTAILECLIRLDKSVVCYCADMPEQILKHFQSQGVEISSEPFDLNHVLIEADAVICHGGRGMIDASIYFGLPMILLPTQLEQMNSAILLERLGAAICIKNEDAKDVLESKIKEFLSNKNYFYMAKSFSEKSRNREYLKPISTVCETCELLLKPIS